MARIAGVNLPNQKRLEIGLTYIYGIGQPTARQICAALGLSPDTKVRDLTEDEVAKLRELHRRELPGRGRPAPRAHAGDQAPVRDRRVPRAAAPPRPAGATASARRRTRARARARRRPSAAGRRRSSLAPPRKAATRGRTRRRVRKNIAIGQAHIKTSFNNTIVALTDPEGNVIVWESAGSAGLQGLAQVDAVRRPGDRRRGRPQGHGARPAEGRGLRRRAPAPAARRRSARSRPPGSRSSASRTSRRRPTTASAPRSGGASRWLATAHRSASSAAARA